MKQLVHAYASRIEDSQNGFVLKIGCHLDELPYLLLGKNIRQVAIGSGSFDFDSLVPIQPKNVLSENLHRTDGLVNKGVGQAPFFFAEIQVFFELFCSDGFRGLTVVSAQLHQHIQIAANCTLAVIAKLEFSDKPITQTFFFFFMILIV